MYDVCDNLLHDMWSQELPMHNVSQQKLIMQQRDLAAAHRNSSLQNANQQHRQLHGAVATLIGLWH